MAARAANRRKESMLRAPMPKTFGLGIPAEKSTVTAPNLGSSSRKHRLSLQPGSRFVNTRNGVAPATSDAAQ
jgi:hypothetical protein